jgi:cobalt-zinc-cadmium efflux system membrane fusion protein
MRRLSRYVPGLTAVVLGGFEISCQVSQAASEAAGASPPPGQVWLTAAQVADAQIEVATVGKQVVESTIVMGGTVTLDELRSGHVFSPVTGRVTRIVATLGQAVKRGDPLATIESPDIGSAVSALQTAQADLIASEHNLRRQSELYAQSATSAANVEASEDAERKAKAELERTRQKQFLLHLANVDVGSQTYTLYAPLDGEVLLRNITPGLEVQGQYSGGAGNDCLPGLTTNATCGELFTIGALDKVWVVGDLYEIDLGRVHVGTRAKVAMVADPGRTFTGTVDWVSGSMDPTTRTAKVRITVDNPNRELRPMMYSTVELSVDERKALAIPRSAVVRLGEYDVVFVEVGEARGQLRFERLPVDVVEGDSALYVTVKHGVDAGQNIVVAGAPSLSQRL